MLVRQMGQNQGRIADVRDQAADHLVIERLIEPGEREAHQHADQHRQNRVREMEDQFLDGSDTPRQGHDAGCQRPHPRTRARQVR